ncbi:MAG: hypothetical protein QOG10_2057, partial [Kribbellaceae bacterium]|nr:hypothetical protein [Kribbellaceae bacterium]
MSGGFVAGSALEVDRLSRDEARV